MTKLNRAAFGQIRTIFEINLANNRIQNISKRAFDGLVTLLTLNLTNNEITYIPNGAFEGLRSLRILDLSHNELEKIDNKTHSLLYDCPSLEKVDLSHNKIAFITRYTLPHDPWTPFKIKDIDFSYNSIPVLNYDFTLGSRNVVFMNLSHNNIQDIRKCKYHDLTQFFELYLDFFFKLNPLIF